MTPNNDQVQPVGGGSSLIGSSLPAIAEKSSKDAAEAEVSLTVDGDTVTGSLNEKRDVLDEEEREWENDPENARNWPCRRKWATVFVVRPLLFHHFPSKT